MKSGSSSSPLSASPCARASLLASAALLLLYLLGAALSGGAAARLRGPPPPPPPPSIRVELGRGTWNLLHRAAQRLPPVPTERERADLLAFFRILGDLYPCDECAEHYRGMLAASPVDARSGPQLAAWLCARHNEVNARLGKARFPCTPEALKERWGDCGCSEGSGGAADDVASPATAAAAGGGGGGGSGAPAAEPAAAAALPALAAAPQAQHRG